MDVQAINLSEKLSLFDEHWSPRIIAQMNDVQVKLAKIQGEFIWHTHPGTDELFLVLKGSMRIEFRESHTALSEGEMCVVPGGMEHRPVAEDLCQIMLIEPTGTVNTGDAGGERTKTVDIWI